MTAASWRPALARYGDDNKEAQPPNVTCHAFVGEPATHGSTYKAILSNQMFAQHCKDIVRSMRTDFKPTSVF